MSLGSGVFFCDGYGLSQNDGRLFIRFMYSAKPRHGWDVSLVPFIPSGLLSFLLFLELLAVQDDIYPLFFPRLLCLFCENNGGTVCSV